VKIIQDFTATVRLRQLAGGTVFRKLDGPAGPFVLSGDMDGETLRIWDPETGDGGIMPADTAVEPYREARLTLEPHKEEVGEFEAQLREVLTPLRGSQTGTGKIPAIRVIRRITGLGLREAKELIDLAPERGVEEARQKVDQLTKQNERLQAVIETQRAQLDAMGDVSDADPLVTIPCSLGVADTYTLGGMLNLLQGMVARGVDVETPLLANVNGGYETIDHAVDHEASLSDEDIPEGCSWSAVPYGKRLPAIILS